MKMFILVLALHFIADFNLQIGAKLHEMKQKEWWERQLKGLDKADRDMYRHDWLCALAIHSLVWSAVTFAPLIYMARSSAVVAVMLIGNAIGHAVVDNAKANYKCISLMADQIVHLMQICMTMLLCAMAEAV